MQVRVNRLVPVTKSDCAASPGGAKCPKGKWGIAGMRIASIALGVVGGVGGLVFAWALFAITMLAGGGQPNVAKVMFYAVLALIVASVLCLVAGLLKPQKPISLKLSLASGAIWIACAMLIVVMKATGANASATWANTLYFAGLVALPSVFPFANAVLISKQA
jgi:hypothetical protein